VGSLPLATPGTTVPAYTAVDARWGWRVTRMVELSLTLQNLLDRAHPEFDTPLTRSEYGRSAFVNVVFRQ
jgi:iron complex outermembrane receptor protein